MRAKLLVWVPVLAAAAACGSGTASVATSNHGTGASPSSGSNSTNVSAGAGANVQTNTVGSTATSSTTCRTSHLAVRLGQRSGAAGSTYAPLVFTNKGTTTCTLYGYPGVSFVAPSTGHQVGAAASRNPQHAPVTVTLRPGAKASAVLRMANEANYPPSDCKPTTVSGLRVYPPGNTAAAYVAFSSPQKACSTSVHQLDIEAVVRGTTGM